MIRRLAFAVILMAAATSASADVSNMIGHWQGFGRSVATGDINNDGRLDVIAQKGHQFHGMLWMPLGAGNDEFAIRGNVNQNRVVNLTGMDSSGNTLDAHGRLIGTDGGVWRFRILNPNGVEIDRGIFILVHMFGFLDWNNDQIDSAAAIDGNWHGFWASNEYFSINAALGHVPNTTMINGFMLDRVNETVTNLSIVGTMSPPSITDGTSNTLMLGVTGGGRVAILIGLLVPAVQGQPKMLMGRVMLWDSFFDVFAELAHGKNLSQSGTYTLTFGPN